MTYTLMGSLRSPFTRIVRIFMQANDIKFELKIVNYLLVKEDADFLEKENPINKIPILLDGDQKIFDSRVIIEHLTRKHQITPLSLDEENMVSAVYAAMDVSVNLFLFKKGGLDLEIDNWYLKRQKDRVPQILKFVTPWAHGLNPSRPADWNYASITLYCYLYWANAIGILSLADYKDLSVFVERFANAPAVRETDFVSPA